MSSKLTHGHCMRRVTHQHYSGVIVSETGTKQPVFDTNRSCFRVIGKLLDQRAEWLSPVVGKFLHKGDTLGIVFRHCDPFLIGPRDDDLDMVPVLAALIKVVGSIQDCDFVRNLICNFRPRDNIQLKKRNTFVSGCDPWKMYGSMECAPPRSSAVYSVDAPRSCTGSEFILQPSGYKTWRATDRAPSEATNKRPVYDEPSSKRAVMLSADESMIFNVLFHCDHISIETHSNFVRVASNADLPER